MDFLSSLTKGGGGGGADDSKKPTGMEKSSSGELLADAKVVAEAAKCQFGNQPDKSYDKAKAAGSAADLLDAAEHYGKLDETKGIGKYAEQAEGYLRSYSGSKPAAAAAHAAGEDKPAPTAADHAPPAAATEKKESEGGYGDLMKAAGGFFNK